MRRQQRDIDIEFIEPERGLNPARLSLALRMLISEKDIIEYFNSASPDSRPTDNSDNAHNKRARPSQA